MPGRKRRRIEEEVEEDVEEEVEEEGEEGEEEEEDEDEEGEEEDEDEEGEEGEEEDEDEEGEGEDEEGEEGEEEDEEDGGEESSTLNSQPEEMSRRVVSSLSGNRRIAKRARRNLDKTPLPIPRGIQGSDKPPSSKRHTYRRRRRIVHKIFADCMECTDDPEWKDYLADAAAGKLYKATFSQNMLKIKGVQSPVLTVDNLGSLEAVFKEIKNFFQQKMHVCFSDIDKVRAESMQMEQADPKTLNEVSSAETGDLLWAYAETEGEKLNFSASEIIALFQSIKYNIAMKFLPKTSIHMRKRRIVHIEGAMIKDKKFVMENTQPPPEEASHWAATKTRNEMLEELTEMVARKKISPINSDFSIRYKKSKMATQWKRLIKNIQAV